MRTSADRNDPGFKNFALCKMGYDIFLNGKRVRLCITADEEKGFVLVHAPDENGNPYLNETETDTVKMRLYGRVEIKPRHDNPR